MIVRFNAIFATEANVWVSSKSYAGYQRFVINGCVMPDEVDLRYNHFGHGSAKVGRLIHHDINADWLVGTFEVNDKSPASASIGRKVLDGELRYLSCGYASVETIPIRPYGSVAVGGRTFETRDDWCDLVTRFCIGEVSLTNNPADRGCRILGAWKVEQERAKTIRGDKPRRRFSYPPATIPPAKPKAPGRCLPPLTPCANGLAVFERTA